MQTRGPNDWEFLFSEAPGNLSRSAATIESGAGVIKPGTLLGKRYRGDLTVTADAGNTGDGVVSAEATKARALVGDYKVEIITAKGNGGTFQVIAPCGRVVGIGEVGTTFDGCGLTFLLSDGTTDFVVGDFFTFTVAAGTGEYVPYDPATGVNGAEEAAAILGAGVDATSAAQMATIIERLAVVKTDKLIGSDADGLASLAEKHIVAR